MESQSGEDLHELSAVKYGEVSEWPKEHAWKVCIPQGIEGSTPSLTAILKRHSA